MRGENAFADLCGASLIPASSGCTTRHRIKYGGDRDQQPPDRLHNPGRLLADRVVALAVNASRAASSTSIGSLLARRRSRLPLGAKQRCALFVATLGVPPSMQRSIRTSEPVGLNATPEEALAIGEASVHGDVTKKPAVERCPVTASAIGSAVDVVVMGEQISGRRQRAVAPTADRCPRDEPDRCSSTRH